MQVKDILAKGGDPRNDGKIDSKSFIVYAQTLPGWFVRRILPTCMQACLLPFCMPPLPRFWRQCPVSCHMHAPCHAPVRHLRLAPVSPVVSAHRHLLLIFDSTSGARLVHAGIEELLTLNLVDQLA